MREFTIEFSFDEDVWLDLRQAGINADTVFQKTTNIFLEPFIPNTGDKIIFKAKGNKEFCFTVKERTFYIGETRINMHLGR